MCVDFRTLSKSNLIGRGGALYPPFGGTEAAPRGMAGSEVSAPPVRSRSHRQIPRGNRRLLALGQRRNRHISSVHFAATFSINISLSPQDYRGFWNLPTDYPMVAPLFRTATRNRQRRLPSAIHSSKQSRRLYPAARQRLIFPVGSPALAGINLVPLPLSGRSVPPSG
jgi:hypothetical protein